jgi:hypothetical protein
MSMVEEDERIQALKILEAMLARNQANREKIEEADLKIAYPLPPETLP